MSAPGLVGVGAVAVGSGDLVPGLPTETLELDVLILLVETADEVVPAMTGWTDLPGSPVSMPTAATRLTARWKRAGAAEAAPTVPDPGDHGVARIIGLRGCSSTGNPWNVTPVAGTDAVSNTTATFPAVTTTVANCLILNMIALGTDTTAAQFSAWTNASLSVVTEQVDSGTTFNNGGVLGAASGVRVAAGSTGSTTVTLATASTKAMLTAAFSGVTAPTPNRPPFDFRVEIAPDAEPDADPDTYVWDDVSSYRRQRNDIDLNVGRDDESDESEAADSSLTFDLRDGRLSPRNPYSDLYGRIGQNTPMRYRLPILSDDFSRTVPSNGWGVSSSGHTWSTASAYSVSGVRGKMTLAAANTAQEIYVTDAGALDVDFVYSVSIDAMPLTQPWISAAEVRRVDANNVYRVHTELMPAGAINLKIVKATTAISLQLDNAVNLGAGLYIVGQKVWTRVQAEGGIIRARVWVGEAVDEPSSGWSITTDEATDPEVEGTGLGFIQWRFAGNTNVGSMTVSVADIAVYALLWQGNVPEWPVRWDKSGNDSYMSLAGAGPLRALNQGEDLLKSALARQLPRYGPAGHWTLEDGSEATVAASSVLGGRAAVALNGMTFGNDDAPAGASSAVQVTSVAATLRGSIIADTTAEWSGLVFFKLTAAPVADSTIIEWRSTSGTLRRWRIMATSTGYRLQVYDEDGTLVENQTTTYGSTDPTEWTAIQLEVDQSGGSVDWDLIWHRIGNGAVFLVMSGNVTGTSARLREFYIPGSTGYLNGLISHVWAGPSSLPFVDAGFLAVAAGYETEPAADRIARLCAEAGRRVTVTAGDSEPMGKQPIGKFLDLIRECAAADLGILYERAGALGYIPRSARYNSPVRMTLDWAGGDLAEAPQPTDDDQRLRNRWTVKRVGGSEATYQNDASIARHGTIPDSDEINIDDDDRLEWHAMWRTSVTTVDELRWPVVVIDLLANPHLIPTFLGLRAGSRIVITNPKDQIAGVEIDLIVEGIKQIIGRHKWRVELSCSPASVWKVAIWGDGAGSSSSLWGSSSTTLGVGRDESQASWTISTVNQYEIWSTTASGYEWKVGPEIVTVNSIGAASGSGPYTQTVSVTRAVNGVSKAHLAGTPIRMAVPSRWAL